MSDPDIDVLEARRRLDAVTRQRARAEADYDAATRAVDTLRRQLLDEFGVDNETAGAARLGELSQELRTALADLHAVLDLAGV